jgi:DNA adenine methylase
MKANSLSLQNTEIKAPVMRYFGGKYRIADWIIGFFPEHRCYVEPFGGAASVLMNKPRSYAEVYNDLSKDLVNVFQVLRNPDQAQRLIEVCRLTPYAREEFELSYESTEDPVERARRTLFRAQAAFGSSGLARSRTGFRIDSERRYKLSSHVWESYPSNIASFCSRLSGVIIENRPAADVITKHDGPDTLFYVDPPYMHSTRVMRNARYDFEMTEDDHVELLQVLERVEGMVAISGYSNPLYEDFLKDWEMHSKPARASGHRGTVLRTEVLWLNPQAAEQRGQITMFEKGLS